MTKKGYWIAHVEPTDPEGYAPYVAGAKPAFERFGARFLVRGGEFTCFEGGAGQTRHVVIEFPSVQAARDCYNSPEYQEAMQHRLKASRNGHLVIVEGN